MRKQQEDFQQVHSLAQAQGEEVVQDGGYWLVCSKCGATVRMQSGSSAIKAIETVSTDQFYVQSYRLEVMGICPDCR